MIIFMFRPHSFQTLQVGTPTITACDAQPKSLIIFIHTWRGHRPDHSRKTRGFPRNAVRVPHPAQFVNIEGFLTG